MKTLRTLGMAFVAFLVWAGVAHSQSWQPLQHQPTFSASTALLLTDGTVMVQQYSGRQWWRLTPDASGSYVNGTWSQLASTASNYAPLYYASAVLKDGRVIVEGGEYNFGSPVWTNLGAIYNPVNNTWTPVTAPSGWTTIGDAQNAILANGKFMLANCCTLEAAFLNPNNLTWTPTGTGKADSNNEEGWTLLPDTTVLTVDTNSGNTHAEKYLPPNATWVSAGNTGVLLVDQGSHELGPAILRPNGTVFYMGATAHTAIYTPPPNPRDPGSWVAGPDFPKAGSQQLDMADAPAALLPGGNVLLVTSPGVFQRNSKFFEFDGSNLIAVPATPNSPNKSSFEFRMLLLPTGQILLTDGTGDVEVYTASGSPDPSWAPTITAAPTQVTRGVSYAITGTQFNGLSEAVGYGDDATAATNYPLVRITNRASGHVFYARTHGHTLMGVANGNKSVSTHFDVPATAETGASDLSVVANSIASTPVTVTVQ